MVRKVQKVTGDRKVLQELSVSKVLEAYREQQEAEEIE